MEREHEQGSFHSISTAGGTLLSTDKQKLR